MKKLTWLLIPLIAFTFVSCGEDADLGNPNTVTETVTIGSWKVQQYMDAGVDQTGDFDGHILTFNKNGTLTVDCNGASCTGTWSEDKVSRKITININNPTAVLSRINTQWTVAEINAALINLSNTEPGSKFLGISRL